MKFYKAQELLRRLSATFMIALLAVSVTACVRAQKHDLSAMDGGATATDREEQLATFTLDPVTGRSEVAETAESFSIPTVQLYNFKVCAHDRRSGDALKGAKFEISGGESVQKIEADISGCLNWSERIAFNFFSVEKYLPLYRKVKAVGLQSGARGIKVGIDPWNISGKASDVVDLRTSSLPSTYLAADADVPKLLSGEAAANSGEHPHFFADQLALEQSSAQLTVEAVHEFSLGSKSGIDRSFKISMLPALGLRNLQNEMTTYSLRKAKGRVSLVIAAPVQAAGGGSTSYELYRTARPIELELVGNSLQALFKAHFDFATSSGSVQLALKFEPEDAPAGLLPFEALYEAGSIAAILNNGAVSLARRSDSWNGDFVYDRFVSGLSQINAGPGAGPGSVPGGIPGLNAAADAVRGTPSVGSPVTGASNPAPNGTGSALPSGVSKLAPFRMGMVQITYLGVSPGETTLKRTINFRAMACLNDVANGNKPASDIDFIVTKTDGSKITVRSLIEPGLEGCVRWTDSVTHTYYEAEKFLLLPIAVEHAPDFREERKLVLNPWDRNSFGRDSKEDASFVAQTNQRPTIPSRLMIDSFGFDTVDNRDYKVDSFLNLTALKRLRLRMAFRVQRYSNVTSGRANAPEALRDGVWALRAGVYAPVKDPSGTESELVSAMTGRARLVRIRGGEMKLDADFEIPDVRLARVRANLVFELLPVDETKLSASESQSLNLEHAKIEEVLSSDSGLVTPTFFGPMWVRDEIGGSSVIPTDDLLADPRAGEASWKSSLRPYANLTVSKLFEKLDVLEAARLKNIQSQASLANMLASENLEYVALMNEQAILANDARLAQNNKALPAGGAFAKFMDAINGRFQAEASNARGGSLVRALIPEAKPQDVLDLLNGKRELNGALESRFCNYFMNELPNMLSKDHQFASAGGEMAGIANACMTGLTQGAGQNYFVVQRFLRTFEVGEARYNRGLDMSLSVSAGTSFSRSTSVDSTNSVTESASANIGIDFAKLFSLTRFLNLSTGFSITGAHTNSWSTSQGASDGSSFQNAALLNLEEAELSLDIKRFERCMVVKVSPQFWRSFAKALAAPREGMTAESRAHILERGVMFCSGQQEVKPVTVTERYYVVGEGSIDETQNDRGDLRNHPWLLSIRGAGDYARLISLLAATRKAGDVPPAIDPASLTVDRLAKVYQGFMPSQPGIFSIDVFRPTAPAVAAPSN